MPNITSCTVLCSRESYKILNNNSYIGYTTCTICDRLKMNIQDIQD